MSGPGVSAPAGGNGLRTTRPSVMGVLAVLGGCVGWILAVLLSSTSHSVVGMSWAVTALWAVFAAVMLGAAWRTYDVLHRKKQRMVSGYAIRLLVMGKATAVVAPAVGGFYLGLGLWRATLGPGSFTQSATLSLLVGGLVLFVAAVGGLLLEIACRRPADPDDEGSAARA
ncbi:MAG TPA: DUF3180 domain-containing protein [Actinopolymorphaceae bacterium]